MTQAAFNLRGELAQTRKLPWAGPPWPVREGGGLLCWAFSRLA